MPPLISRERLRRIFCATVAAAALSGAAPAIASACTAASGGSEILKQFGDTNSYVLAPGGSFESGALGWSLTGSAVVSGNETNYVDGKGSHSLSISPEGAAVTPVICAGVSTPSFRFFARQTNGSGARLNVEVLWTDPQGTTLSAPVGAVDGTTSWSLSPLMHLGDLLPSWLSTATFQVRLEFAPAYGGGWQIDDVNIDPYARR